MSSLNYCNQFLSAHLTISDTVWHPSVLAGNICISIVLYYLFDWQTAFLQFNFFVLSAIRVVGILFLLYLFNNAKGLNNLNASPLNIQVKALSKSYGWLLHAGYWSIILLIFYFKAENLYTSGLYPYNFLIYSYAVRFFFLLLLCYSFLFFFNPALQITSTAAFLAAVSCSDYRFRSAPYLPDHSHGPPLPFFKPSTNRRFPLFDGKPGCDVRLLLRLFYRFLLFPGYLCQAA